MLYTSFCIQQKKRTGIRLNLLHTGGSLCTRLFEKKHWQIDVYKRQVLRRLIRRAARHGKMLGIDGLFLAKLSETVINESKDGYPELEEKKEFIFKVLTQEEEKFNKTIDQGLAILSDLMEEMCIRDRQGADTTARGPARAAR